MHTFVHAHCWAHVRRKFIELETSFPTEAGEALERINALFMLEREYPEHMTNTKSLAMRTVMRADKFAPLIRDLGEWLHSLRALPQRGLGKAARYATNLWPGLTRFVIDAHISLSNNAAERSVRGAVIGRKNYYGARSERGCEVTAILYSLFESAKRCELEPKAYWRAAVQDAFAGRTVRLPHEMKAELAK